VQIFGLSFGPTPLACGTSLRTGRTPGHHGIFDFFQPRCPVASAYPLRRSLCAMSAPIGFGRWLTRQGIRTTSSPISAMFPTPTSMVRLFPWAGCRETAPASPAIRLNYSTALLCWLLIHAFAMDMTLCFPRRPKGGKEEEYVAWAELHTQREQQWLRVSRSLIRRAIPLNNRRVVGWSLIRFSICAGASSRPRPTFQVTQRPEEQRIHDQCRVFQAAIDGVLQATVEQAGPGHTTP